MKEPTLKSPTPNTHLQATWIPLMEYAIKKGISLSTLRRHIKANKISYKIENGRYLLLDGPEKIPELKSEIEALTLALNQAKEEIAELKTLIAFYEENPPNERLQN